MIFSLKLVGNILAASVTVATLHRAQSSARTPRQGHSVPCTLRTGSVWELLRSEGSGSSGSSLEMSEFSLLFLMGDLPSEALALAGKH